MCVKGMRTIVISRGIEQRWQTTDSREKGEKEDKNIMLLINKAMMTNYQYCVLYLKIL